MNIELNSNMLSSASKVFVAKTMLHELIHSHIFNKLYSTGNINIPSNPSDFPSLWNSYVNNNANGQHEYMANYYVEIIKDALQDYYSDAGININNNVLKAISWSGLKNTTAWNNLPQATRTQYENIMFQQVLAGGCP